MTPKPAPNVVEKLARALAQHGENAHNRFHEEADTPGPYWVELAHAAIAMLSSDVPEAGPDTHPEDPLPWAVDDGWLGNDANGERVECSAPAIVHRVNAFPALLAALTAARARCEELDSCFRYFFGEEYAKVCNFDAVLAYLRGEGEDPEHVECRAQLREAERERDEARKVAVEQADEARQLRLERNDAARLASDGAWVWSETDPNDIDSMATGMLVTMTAGQLQRLLRARVAELEAEAGTAMDDAVKNALQCVLWGANARHDDAREYRYLVRPMLREAWEKLSATARTGALEGLNVPPDDALLPKPDELADALGELRCPRCRGNCYLGKAYENLCPACGGKGWSKPPMSPEQRAALESGAPLPRLEAERDDARAMACIEAHTAISAVELAGCPSDIRAAGWSVGVHNDYRLNGKPHTFWLFTKGNECVKGEGPTDADALNQVRAALDARRKK